VVGCEGARRVCVCARAFVRVVAHAWGCAWVWVAVRVCMYVQHGCTCLRKAEGEVRVRSRERAYSSAFLARSERVGAGRWSVLCCGCVSSRRVLSLAVVLRSRTPRSPMPADANASNPESKKSVCVPVRTIACQSLPTSTIQVDFVPHDECSVPSAFKVTVPAAAVPSGCQLQTESDNSARAAVNWSAAAAATPRHCQLTIGNAASSTFASGSEPFSLLRRSPWAPLSSDVNEDRDRFKWSSSSFRSSTSCQHSRMSRPLPSTRWLVVASTCSPRRS
jgi:hypothetical protein